MPSLRESPDRHRHHQRFPLSDMQGRVDRSQYEEAILTLLTKMYDPANRMLHESQGDQEGRSQLLCSERIAYAPKTKSSASPFRAFEIARDRMCELVGYSPDQMNKIVRALEERLLDVFQDPESLSPKQHQSRPPSSASSQEQTFGDGHEWEDQDDSDEDEEAIAATLTQSFNDMHT